MPTTLPTDDADTTDYIQFRGPQTSVVHDRTGVRFTTEERGGNRVQKPLPVVDPDDPPADVPDDAVALPVAQELVDTNPLVAWGVACPECGDVFDTPRAVASHRSTHADGSEADGEADDDPETEA